MSKEAMKLVPVEPTEEMLKAMDECSKEGYDERLYAGHAASVYMAAVDASPAQEQCRTDGRCQYAIDSGAEGMGHCPKGKCVMPAQQEPVADMPSNTRYTVEVEGHGRTYWNNIHDAITCAQRAVYAGVNNTSRALDDLKAGRIAEWSYGFSAVRIYPPQNTSLPQRKPLTVTEVEQILAQHNYEIHGDRARYIVRMTEAAHGIKE